MFLTPLPTDMILTTIKKAIDNHEPFHLHCPEVHEGYMMPLLTLNVKSLTRHFHESFWGDDRDDGIAPLHCVDLEFVINASDRLEDKEIIEVLAKAFEDEMGVRLFKCSLGKEVITRLIRGRVVTQEGRKEFKIRASQDPRLLDIDSKAMVKEWKKNKELAKG